MNITHVFDTDIIVLSYIDESNLLYLKTLNSEYNNAINNYFNITKKKKIIATQSISTINLLKEYFGVININENDILNFCVNCCSELVGYNWVNLWNLFHQIYKPLRYILI